MTSVGALGVEGESLVGGATTQRVYDAKSGLISTIKTTNTGVKIQDLTYQWRSNGSLESRSNNKSGVPVIDNFTYDNLDTIINCICNDIDHTKTKAQSPQTNGICERFHKTILQEFYQVTFRKKLYFTLEELQKDLGEWIQYYNNEWTHQDKMCCGRIPLETLLDGKRIWAEKNLAQI